MSDLSIQMPEGWNSSNAFLLDNFDLSAAAKSFKNEGVTVLKGFLQGNFFEEMRALADELFTSGAHRNDMMIDGTPRNIDVVGGEVMDKQSRVISLYQDVADSDWFRQIVGGTTVACPNKTEHVIMSRISKVGDTHGTHLDDYPIAFIMCLEFPSSVRGAQVQYKPLGSIDISMDHGEVRSIALEPGDTYVMNTKDLWHRVSPILKNAYGRRTILNFTYAYEGVPVIERRASYKFCAPGHEKARDPEVGDLAPLGRTIGGNSGNGVGLGAAANRVLLSPTFA